MRMHLTAEAVVGALVDGLAQAWSSRAGSATVAPLADSVGPDGWLASWSMTGPVQGRASIWFDRSATADCVRSLQKLEDAPADDRVETFLREVLADAVKAFSAAAPLAGSTAGDIELAPGTLPAAATTYELSAVDMPVWLVACWSDVTAASAAAAPASDERLSAVLEVELPLVVRFGRAVMPFRALASLGPGSVVDMGRSPEEPVELLVGERLIARGEVVIVGGNYGVRITELTGARHVAAGIDGRAS